jgi:hypothetical protein
MRKLFASFGSLGILVAALLGSNLPAQADSAALKPIHTQIHRAHPNESYAQYYRRRYYHRHYYRGGDALAAGAVGLAAGALIGTAIASQAQAQAAPPPPGTVDPQVAAYCARKYRSYDPVTGTFMATNGMRYVCTYP